MHLNACAIRKIKADMTATRRDDGEAQDLNHEKYGGRRDELPSEILEIMIPALKAGALTGATGVFVGAFAGVARSSTPKLFAAASGLQWFTLGTTFWASRGFLYHAWGQDRITEQNKVSASALSGAFAGSVGGLLRGPRNVIPGAIMFALFGGCGQIMYNKLDARYSQRPATSSDIQKSSWMDSKWSPVKVLTDEEYEKILQEKLLRVNVEIALVDDNIDLLRAQERAIAAKKVEVVVDPELK